MYTGREHRENTGNDAISIEHRGMQCVMENPLDWDKKPPNFFTDAKCLILNVPARMAYPQIAS
jgi:hypothetical protein